MGGAEAGIVSVGLLRSGQSPLQSSPTESKVPHSVYFGSLHCPPDRFVATTNTLLTPPWDSSQ
jgi:hypothetical protein